MAKDYSITVGTIGTGMWNSPDGGETWNWTRTPFPPLEAPVRSLASFPDNPHHILAGADRGLYLSEDNGATWRKLDSPMEGTQTWSIAIDPVDPNIIFAGTKPPAIWRSRNRGQMWKKLPVQIAEWCEAVGPPRVNVLRVDPDDQRIIWAGIEADGVRRSMDGGDTWTTVMSEFNDDIHSIAILPTNPKTVLVSTPWEVFISKDNGETWGSVVKSEQLPMPYCRCLGFKPDNPQVLYLGIGDYAIGKVGGVMRSKDAGKSWESLPLPGKTNSNMWDLATHPSDPNVILCGTLLGEVYASDDAGDSWRKFNQGFGDLRVVAWTPN
jgi:photosystem II stability/assembly factor-like uncharacterized protein